MSDFPIYSDLQNHHLWSGISLSYERALAEGDSQRALAVLQWTLVQDTNLDTWPKSWVTSGIPLVQALDPAKRSGHPVDVELVRWLLENGTQITVPSGQLYDPLFYAIQSGSLAAVEMLLEHGAPANPNSSAQFLYISPLVNAIKQGHTEIALCLLKFGANPYGEKHYPRPLQVAARKGDLEVARALLDLGVDVNEQDAEADQQISNRTGYDPANTALMEAVRKDHNLVLDLLLQHGADVNASGRYGNTALHFCLYDDISAANLELLFQRGANLKESEVPSTQLLQFAVQVPKWLTQFKFDPETQSSVQTVIEKKDAHAVVQTLITHQDKLKLSTESWQGALSIAVNNRDLTNTIALLRANAEIGDHAPALWAMANEGNDLQHQELRSLLQLHGAEPSENEQVDLLTEAVEAGNLQRVRFLIQNGVNVNPPDRENPLVAAIEKDYHEIAQALLEAGADPNCRSEENSFTALMLAVESARYRYNDRSKYRHLPVERTQAAEAQDVLLVQALIEVGADLTAKTSNGNTALHFAGGAVPQVIQILIEAGADVNAVNNIGRTPIFDAVMRGRARIVLEKLPSMPHPTTDPNPTAPQIQENWQQWQDAVSVDETVVQLLLDAGANPHVTGNDGYPLLHLATSYSTAGVVQRLLSAGVASNSLSAHGTTAAQILFHLGRTAELFQESKLRLVDFQWLTDDMIAAASGTLAITELVETAEYELQFAVKEDVLILEQLFAAQGQGNPPG